MTRRRVLVIGTDDWAIDQAAAELAGAGWSVHRCHQPGQPAFPCDAFRKGGRCPVEDGVDVTLDMRARVLDHLAFGELGALCSLRASTPVIIAGAVAPGDPVARLGAVLDPQGTLDGACTAATAATH